MAFTAGANIIERADIPTPSGRSAVDGHSDGSSRIIFHLRLNDGSSLLSKTNHYVFKSARFRKPVIFLPNTLQKYCLCLKTS